MIESRYLEDSFENIQKLIAIPGLRSFDTKSVGKLLKIRTYLKKNLDIKS